jgi:hypothetical protein
MAEPPRVPSMARHASIPTATKVFHGHASVRHHTVAQIGLASKPSLLSLSPLPRRCEVSRRRLTLVPFGDDGGEVPEGCGEVQGLA